MANPAQSLSLPLQKVGGHQRVGAVTVAAASPEPAPRSGPADRPQNRGHPAAAAPWALRSFVAVEVVGVGFGDGAVRGDGDEASAQVVGVGLLDGRAAEGFDLGRDAAEGVAGAGGQMPRRVPPRHRKTSPSLFNRRHASIRRLSSVLSNA